MKTATASGSAWADSGAHDRPTPAVGAEPTDVAAAQRAGSPTGNPSLAEVGTTFYRYGSPRLLSIGLAASLVARLAVGAWSPWDLAVVAAFLLWQPFQEWLIHVHVLHWRPRRILGVHVDPVLSRKHRSHHVDPWQVSNLFIPKATIIMSFCLQAPLFLWLMPLPLALTAMASLFAIGLTYEWVHYLIHTAYRPRSRAFRKVWQYHRLHHFKNENYWMGVTMHLGDQVFGTMPEPKQVPLSPTARSLAEG